MYLYFTAAAINVYNDAIESLIEGQLALEKKYPDFYASFKRMDDDASSGDAEVDAAQKKFDSESDTFGETAILKIMQNYSDPKVKAAMTRMYQIMGSMDTGDDDDDDDAGDDQDDF